VSQISEERVLYFPLTGDMERMNPVPEKALERRGARPTEALAWAGLEPISLREAEAYSSKDVQDFLREYRIPGTLPDTMLADNYKTAKPRVATGKEGKIVGLNLMPHFYANILNLPEMDPLSWTFNEKGGSEDQADYEQQRIRRFFNSFDGFSQETAAVSAKVPEGQGLLNFCLGSSEHCRSTCLVLTGNHASAFQASQKKLKLTYAFLTNPVLFIAALDRSLTLFECQCRVVDTDPVVRLNMLSDIPWYVLCPEIFEKHGQDLSKKKGQQKGIAFYDYSKLPFWKSKEYKKVEHLLDLTYSYSGSNAGRCQEALENGYRVAAVFASAAPERIGASSGVSRTTFHEIVGGSGLIDAEGKIDLFGGKWTAVDGDVSDYRIDDPSGFNKKGESQACIVCLNFKAPPLATALQPAEERKLVTLGKRRDSLTEKEAEDLADLERKKLDVAAYQTFRERLPGARKEFSVLVPSTELGISITRALLKKDLWDPLEEQRVFAWMFTPEQVLELAGLTPQEGIQKALRWYAEQKEDVANQKRGLAMQRVIPTSAKARKNGAEGLLIGPHTPTVAND
jgi:hypothetical protein